MYQMKPFLIPIGRLRALSGCRQTQFQFLISISSKEGPVLVVLDFFSFQTKTALQQFLKDNSFIMASENLSGENTFPDYNLAMVLIQNWLQSKCHLVPFVLLKNNLILLSSYCKVRLTLDCPLLLATEFCGWICDL